MSENEGHVVNHDPLIHAFYEVSGRRAGLKRYIQRYLRKREGKDDIN